jgi:uncharacterized membrane protein YtjA (UPF0391 family)
MARIFISYRREEGGAAAGRLHDRLSEHFGRDNVFIDIDTIEPGLDFVDVIERTVASCDVLIALIERQWLTSTDAAGQRRLDNPEGFVRQEIAMALRRNIRVIPALIQDTPMPRTTDLPEDLKTLTRRNALEISDTHFHRDVDRLIVVLDRVLRPATAGTPQTETRGPAPPRPRSEARDSAIPHSGSRMATATSQPHAPRRGAAQLSWGIAFLIIALVVALFGFGGIASTVSGIAKLLFFLFLTIFIIMLVLGLISRRRV